VSELEAKIIEILQDKEIMEFSDTEFERYANRYHEPYSEPDFAPCTCDDDILCEHRIRTLAQKIATMVEARD
jgi:hypothetical protein